MVKMNNKIRMIIMIICNSKLFTTGSLHLRENNKIHIYRELIVIKEIITAYHCLKLKEMLVDNNNYLIIL